MSRYHAVNNMVLTDEVRDDILENCPSLRTLAMASGSWRVVYGFDHVLAWFVQFWPSDEKAKEFLEELGDIDNELECLDFDYVFDSFAGCELGHILKMVGAKQEHIDCCFLDLSF